MDICLSSTQRDINCLCSVWAMMLHFLWSYSAYLHIPIWGQNSQKWLGQSAHGAKYGCNSLLIQLFFSLFLFSNLMLEFRLLQASKKINCPGNRQLVREKKNKPEGLRRAGCVPSIHIILLLLVIQPEKPTIKTLACTYKRSRLTKGYCVCERS